MIIPTLPQVELVDDKRMLTNEWRIFFDQLIQNMQLALGEEGFQNPEQPTTNIALLTNPANGTIIYDSTLDEFKGAVAGIFKTFTLT